MVIKRPLTWTDQKVERSEEEMNEDKRIVPDAQAPLLMLWLQMYSKVKLTELQVRRECVTG